MPSDGIYAIGSELISRVNGVITRGVEGSTAVAHSSAEAVQLAFVYDGDLVEMIRQLLLTAGISESVLPQTEWNAIRDLGYAGHTFKLIVGRPTSLRELLDRLLPLGPLTVGWDSSDNKILPIGQNVWIRPAAFIGEESIVAETDLRVRYREDKHATLASVAYGAPHPLDNNTTRRSVAADAAASSEFLWGRVYPRLIDEPLLPSNAGNIALLSATRLLARYGAPTYPLEIEMSVREDFPFADRLGAIYEISLAGIATNASGRPQKIRAQIIRSEHDIENGMRRLKLLQYASELPQVIADNEIILVDGDVPYDKAGRPVGAFMGTFRVSSHIRGIDFSDFDPESLILLIVDSGASIYGSGGKGASTPFGHAFSGGDAVSVRSGTLTIINHGVVAGGGGGGAAAFVRGGGGGQGRPGGGGGKGLGRSGIDGGDGGESFAGGASSPAAAGGGLGQPGGDYAVAGQFGGNAGRSVVAHSGAAYIISMIGVGQYIGDIVRL